MKSHEIMRMSVARDVRETSDYKELCARGDLEPLPRVLAGADIHFISGYGLISDAILACRNCG